MDRRRILTVIGTRPEAIKLAPVVLEAQSRSAKFDCTLVSTAQHRDLLDQMLELFTLKPDVDLNLMRPGQSPLQVLEQVVGSLGTIIDDVRPHAVVLQGDTTTAMGAAMVAFLKKIPVAHVEAGLRSYDRWNPFPEEINRRVAGLVAEWHFAPTAGARANLVKEGVDPNKIHVTGNTVVDALLRINAQPFSDGNPEVTGLPISEGRLILVTAHRRESFGAPLRRICAALQTLVRRHPDVAIVYPVHPNPEVKDVVYPLLRDEPRIHLIPPVTYRTMVHLLRLCYMVLTDSGGIQEEAPSFRKPVLVLRDVTERPEAVEAGVARVLGTNTEQIVRESERLLNDPDRYAAMARGDNPFGDGRAAHRIVDVLESEIRVR